MQRVVITGMGIVSCLGNNQQEVLASLKAGKSGIRTDQSHIDKQFRSHISGVPQIDLDALIDRKIKRFMGDGAAYAYLSMKEAIEQAGLSQDQVSSLRTGLIVGAGGHSPRNEFDAIKTLEERGLRRVGPYMVPRVMGSSISANLATAYQIKGINYSISSACATSAHCIGNAMEQIQLGKADVMFAGGGEECFWSFSMMFDAMGALSTKYNDTPEKASRAYDKNRDGFVIAGGGGIVVLESLEHALKRGANIIAEVVGYGATSDGEDMVAPSGEGATRCMQIALQGVKHPVDYINTHGTSTPVGDVAELGAIRNVFGKEVPPISSTKSLSGHSLGAAGVQEAIYCLLMMQNDFICASANIEELDPAAADLPIVRETRNGVKLNTVLSNSFGFGGTNATLVMQRFQK